MRKLGLGHRMGVILGGILLVAFTGLVLIQARQTAVYAARNAHDNDALLRGMALGGTALAVTLAAVFWLARSITRPLLGVTSDLGATAESLESASAELQQASRAISDGASNQAASFEETAASLEEMASMTHRNAEHAASAKGLAGDARSAADTGALDMAQMAQAMQEIKAAGDSIAKIIRTIDEIAFQTNILALNAAVEAARAGEQGLGFAVVADEVRSLAQRSAAAARETTAKINDAISKSERGVVLSGKVASGLQDILGKVRQVDELVGQIASASHDQSEGISQINQAVSRMEEVTQANAATTEETTQSIGQLTDQAKALKRTVRDLDRLVRGDGMKRPAVAAPARPAAPAPGPTNRPPTAAAAEPFVHTLIRNPGRSQKPADTHVRTPSEASRSEAFPMPPPRPGAPAPSPGKVAQGGSVELFQDF